MAVSFVQVIKKNEYRTHPDAYPFQICLAEGSKIINRNCTRERISKGKMFTFKSINALLFCAIQFIEL